MNNLKQFIKERNIDIACISESWERVEEPLQNLIRMDKYEIISNPYARKEGGGRPALIINKEMFTVEDPNQSLIKIEWGVECTWALLTPKNTSNSSLVKKIAVASFYCKPGSRKKSALIDHLSQVYHFLSARYKSGLYFILAGDKNELKIDQIMLLSSDFKQLVQQPTRMMPPAILDIIISDLHKFYNIPTVEAPLQVDSDKVGSDSDHHMVILTPISNFQNTKGRSIRHVEFRPLTDDGFQAMEETLSQYDWGQIFNIKSACDQMTYFQNSLFEIYSQCFPTKKRKFFSESEPFYTDKLAKLKRRKGREFSKNRNSNKYLSLHETYKKELLKAKRTYYREKIRQLRTSNPRSWYQHIKKLMGNNQSEEHIEVEDIKDLSDEEQCEQIASKFVEVSNLYEPLQRQKINFPIFSIEETPVVSDENVSEALKSLNAAKSTRKNDIPAKVLKRIAPVITKPLTLIINNCLQQGVWPDIFKLEMVTPIPKVPAPKDIDDLRNISGLMNLNKVMEKIICPLIFEDMKSTFDPAQYANQAGISTQHYLIRMVDRILKATDNSTKGECVAVIATLVDWRKAYPMLDHTLGVKSFIENGARPSLIPLIASFLENRRMRVKWHGKESSERSLPGSSPQGSNFGILEYLSQSNDNASTVPIQDKFKWMDDLSILEIINLANIGLASHNNKSSVPSNIPIHNQVIPSEHLKTQQYLNEINMWTESKKMQLNQKKTKCMIFNFTKDKQFTTDLKLKGEEIEIVEETKLLGTIISNDLKWNKNTNFIVNKHH